MDGPKPKTSPHHPHGRFGADAAPITFDDTVVGPGADQAEAIANPLRESSHALYCDDREEVRKGFAMALRVMGL